MLSNSYLSTNILNWNNLLLGILDWTLMEKWETTTTLDGVEIDTKSLRNIERGA